MSTKNWWSQDRTPSEWMKAALEFSRKRVEQYTRQEESFQRCDTDGFLSQWASGLSAEQSSRSADLAASFGIDTTVGLYAIGEGGELTRANARAISVRDNFKFGEVTKWIVNHPDGTVSFLPYHPKRESTLAKRGYREVIEYTRCWITIDGCGRGLSGRAWVARKPLDVNMPIGKESDFAVMFSGALHADGRSVASFRWVFKTKAEGLAVLNSLEAEGFELAIHNVIEVADCVVA